MSLLPETDLPGFDYQTIKNSTAKGCETTCLDDNLCRAFTFNSKAKWCFLKGDIGTAAPFKGATSGTVTLSPTAEDLAKTREGELPFPAAYLIDSAKYFASQLPSTDAPPADISYADLVASGDEAADQGNPAAAMVSYRQALAINQNDPALWLKLAEATLIQADAEFDRQNTSSSYDLGATATYAALEAYLKSESVKDRAATMGALAHGLERRSMWREAIVTYRASIALVDDATLQARLDKAVAEHGFRITSNEVDSEAADPRICITFSDPLPAATTDLSSYIVVENAPNIAVETDGSQICITGVEHGKRYHIKVRAGLPSADNETLRKDAELDLYVADRSPFVGFANTAYVLPAGLGGGLPITSINAKTADVVIYRIGDRAIATAVRDGIFRGTLSGYSAEDVANRYGEKSWEGQVDLAQAAPTPCRRRRFPSPKSCPTCSPARMWSPPASPATSHRNTGTMSPRSGSSSPISV